MCRVLRCCNLPRSRRLYTQISRVLQTPPWSNIYLHSCYERTKEFCNSIFIFFFCAINTFSRASAQHALRSEKQIVFSWYFIWSIFQIPYYFLIRLKLIIIIKKPFENSNKHCTIFIAYLRNIFTENYWHNEFCFPLYKTWQFRENYHCNKIVLPRGRCPFHKTSSRAVYV